MSDSVAKYYELLQEGKLTHQSVNHKAVQLISQIVAASHSVGNLDTLLSKVDRLSSQNPNLSPTMVFDIVSEEMKVDEVCTTKTNM